MLNRESLSYEMGVLMFQLVSNHHLSVSMPLSHCISTYDKWGNFYSLYQAVQTEIIEQELYLGFLTEYQNVTGSADGQEAGTLFYQTLFRIKQNDPEKRYESEYQEIKSGGTLWLSRDEIERLEEYGQTVMNDDKFIVQEFMEGDDVFRVHL